MVQYKKGKDNLVADALFRKVETEDDWPQICCLARLNL